MGGWNKSIRGEEREQERKGRKVEGHQWYYIRSAGLKQNRIGNLQREVRTGMTEKLSQNHVRNAMGYKQLGWGQAGGSQ